MERLHAEHAESVCRGQKGSEEHRERRAIKALAGLEHPGDAAARHAARKCASLAVERREGRGRDALAGELHVEHDEWVAQWWPPWCALGLAAGAPAGGNTAGKQRGAIQRGATQRLG